MAYYSDISLPSSPEIPSDEDNHSEVYGWWEEKPPSPSRRRQKRQRHNSPVLSSYDRAERAPNAILERYERKKAAAKEREAAEAAAAAKEGEAAEAAEATTAKESKAVADKKKRAVAGSE